MSEKNKYMHYEWSIKVADDNRLYFNFCCEVFSQLFNIEPKDYGKPIEEILSPEAVLSAYETYEKLMKFNDFQSTAREIDGDFWNVEIEYHPPIISFHGTRIGDIFAINKVTKINDIGSAVFKNKLNDAILIKQVGNDYVIESISQKTSKLISLSKGDSIKGVLKYLYTLKSYSIIDSCLKFEDTAKILDIFTSSDKSFTDYLLMVFVPLKHDENRVLISFHSLEQDTYCNLQNNQAPSIFSEFKDSEVAVASFITNNSGQYHLEYYNDYFHSVYDSRSAKYTIANEVLNKCIEHHSIKHSTINIDNNEYFCVGIPTFQNNKVYVFITPQVEVHESMDKIFTTLTKREDEIARLLVNGQTIKYISYNLNIAEGTVKKTISNIYKKLEVCSRVDLIRKVFNS